MGARRRALSDDDVELVILERGVKLFFQHRLHAVNLVEEKHLPLAQIGQDGGQVALDHAGPGRKFAGSRRQVHWQ